MRTTAAIFLFCCMMSPAIQAQTTCSNATLNGKYAVSGQGNVFNCLLGPVCSDQTTSTVGYIWFDGNGGAVALDSDPDVDEALELSRTVDPLQGCGACGTFTLAGISTRGLSRGTDPSGRKVSSIVEMTFLDASSFQGTEKVSTNNNFSTDSFTGSYVINADCTVNLTKNVNGTQISGAHVITGGDPAGHAGHIVVWRGDSYGRADAELAIDAEVE